MSNMSYCRFHNTKIDMQDCLYAIEERENLSDREYRAARSMFLSILEFFIEADIIEDYDDDALYELLDECNREGGEYYE